MALPRGAMGMSAVSDLGISCSYSLTILAYVLPKHIDTEYIVDAKIVSMIKKYHNQKPQTNPWHRREEQHNHHETPLRHTKQSNQLPLPHQDDSKTRMDIR